MRRVGLILLSIAVAAAADKEKPRFVAAPAESYKGHQVLDNITLAAVPYVSDEQVKTAFGKVDPNRYGVLPVLVVMQNGTGKALRLNLKAEFVTVDGHHYDAISPDDVMHTGYTPKAPRIGGGSPIPIPLPARKKGPLNTWEIEGRSFVAKLLPERETASGFFYFLTEPEPGSRLYLTGIKEADTGKDLFYFEVPLVVQ